MRYASKKASNRLEANDLDMDVIREAIFLNTAYHIYLDGITAFCRNF